MTALILLWNALPQEPTKQCMERVLEYHLVDLACESLMLILIQLDFEDWPFEIGMKWSLLCLHLPETSSASGYKQSD